MQLGAKRAVDARATLLLGRGWCKTQNAHEARPRPSFRGQKAVSHVVWTQIPSTVLPPGQMAKCENCDSVHWQRQQSSVQVREPETGVEKVKRKWLQRTGPQVKVLENVAADKGPPQCWKTLFSRWSNAQPHDSARLLLFLVVSRSLISSSC